jgi:hypothetical protein
MSVSNLLFRQWVISRSSERVSGIITGLGRTNDELVVLDMDGGNSDDINGRFGDILWGLWAVYRDILLLLHMLWGMPVVWLGNRMAVCNDWVYMGLEMDLLALVDICCGVHDKPGIRERVFCAEYSAESHRTDWYRSTLPLHLYKKHLPLQTKPNIILLTAKSFFARSLFTLFIFKQARPFRLTLSAAVFPSLSPRIVPCNPQYSSFFFCYRLGEAASISHHSLPQLVI